MVEFDHFKIRIIHHFPCTKKRTKILKIMKIPKIKEDESLAMWRERLARELNLDYKMQELIREVSITSYIRGTNDILDTLKKEGKI